MRLAVLALLLAGPAFAQQGGHEAKKDAKPVASPTAPVIGCTSLANLRALQREAGTDIAAAMAAIHRPGSDLGCSAIDPAQVTAVADHVALGGQAYECLSLQGTVVCHWAPAGRLAPVAAPAAGSSANSSANSSAKTRPAEKPKR